MSAIEPKFFGMELISQYLRNDDDDVDDDDANDVVVAAAAADVATVFNLASFNKLFIFLWTLASSR